VKGTSAFGWQTSLADLSLILFMLSAAALHRQPPARPQEQRIERPQPRTSVHPAASPPARPAPRSEPLAVYEATAGAPPLGVWLEQQAIDPRQQLTIIARYGPAPGSRDAALGSAVRLLGEAGVAGASARLVVEPGSGPVRVVLAYDRPA